jgi:L,D-transpeptidase catalytic domain
MIAPLVYAAPDMPVLVAEHAAEAYACTATREPLLIVADMSLKNTAARLWAFDLKQPGHPRLIIESRVEHGSGSDPQRTGYAVHFSNAPDSLATSLGLYRVAEPYESPTHGRAYRLEGLTAGWNDHAYERDVNFHSSTFVDSDRVSWSSGCLATPAQVIPAIEHAMHTSLSGAVVWVDGPVPMVPMPHCSLLQPAWSSSTPAERWGLSQRSCTM